MMGGTGTDEQGRTRTEGLSKVFISYSHKDAAWKDRVLKHLRVLEAAGEFTVWDDQRIKAGEAWLPEIEAAMNAAEVAVLLVSADFLTSAFIGRSEIPRLLERRLAEGLRVIPVFVGPCAWKAVGWLADLQGRPRSGKALTELRKHQAENELAALALEIGGFLGKRAPSDPGLVPQSEAPPKPKDESHPPTSRSGPSPAGALRLPPPSDPVVPQSEAPPQPKDELVVFPSLPLPEPVLSVELPQYLEPSPEFRHARDRSFISLACSLSGLGCIWGLIGNSFSSDFHWPFFTYSLLFIMAGLGFGISALRIFNNLNIKRGRWPAVLAKWLAILTAIFLAFISFIFKFEPAG